MTSTTPERKQCSVCPGEYTVTASGTIRHHTTDNPAFQAGPDSRKCKGAGEKPAGAAEATTADGPQCRLCKHPVQLTDNGRARSHLTPEATPRSCPGGSDFPLGQYPDMTGTTDGLVATIRAECEHVPVGQCYACWAADGAKSCPDHGDPIECTCQAKEGQAQAMAEKRQTMADQLKAAPFTGALTRETSGAGTVLDAMDDDTRDEAARFMEAGIPKQPTARVEHVYTDPSGVQRAHEGPAESCQAPDCIVMRSSDPHAYEAAVRIATVEAERAEEDRQHHEILTDVRRRAYPDRVYCEKCDTDNHRCPGCGTDVPHGTVACTECTARVDAEKAERQAKCTHPDGFTDTIFVTGADGQGREVPACEHCDAVAPASKLPQGRTEDGRPCDHHDGVFGVEDGKTVCVACGTPCTHPDGFTENDPTDDDGEGLVFTCAICGTVDPGDEPTGGTDDWRTPDGMIQELMTEQVQGLDALRLNCAGCGHPVTPLVGHFDLYGKAASVEWTCKESVTSGNRTCRDHECAPDTRALLGDLEVGDHFVRRGAVMRVTDTLSGDVHAVVTEGPMKGRTGVLPDNHETVERTHCRHRFSYADDGQFGHSGTFCDYCGKKQESTQCTDDRTPQQRPVSSAASTPTTTSPTTAPAAGSRPGTKVSVPTVSPKSGSVTSSAPTAKAAGRGGSAAVTTDQAQAAAAFLGSGRPTAPAPTGAQDQAAAAAQFLAGGSGAHGEKETKRDRFGRYLIPHPDTGKEQAWTRSTTFAKSISDTYALSQWGLRMALLGATQRPDIVQRAHGKHVSADKKLLDELTAELKNAAGDKVAANLGTSMHSFTEMADRAWHSPGGPRSILDQVPLDCRGDVETYIRLLEETGLEPVPHLIEFTTVVKQYGVAGTSDNCYKVTKPLTLTIGRGEVHFKPGEYTIGDKKTGKSLDYGWQEIAIQLGTYAQGINTSGVWDRAGEVWEPDPLGRFDKPGTKVRLDAGIVVHLPVDKGGDKQPAVYGVDLESGWQAAVLCERVRAWRKVRKLASLVMVSEAEAFAPARPEPQVVSRTTVRPPSLMDKANAVTSKSEASAVWQEAKAAGLDGAQVDELVAVIQNRLKKLAEPAG